MIQQTCSCLSVKLFKKERGCTTTVCAAILKNSWSACFTTVMAAIAYTLVESSGGSIDLLKQALLLASRCNKMP